MAPEENNKSKRKTIKLKPLAPKAEGVTSEEDAIVTSTFQPEGEEAAEATISMDRDELDNEITTKIPKPAPKNSSSLPGAKQTIKLRPSSSASAEDDTQTKPASASTIKLQPKSDVADGISEDDEKTVAMAKQTIRLVPKKSDGKKADVKPSDPTIDLNAKKNTKGKKAKAKPSDPTVKLDPKTKADNDVTETVTVETQDKPKIGIKKDIPGITSMTTQQRKAAAAEEVEKATVSDDPGPLMTVASVLALASMLFLAITLFMQYNML